jgi:murein DD-endopeptidase MepM/ murein hydrolase activator NlpD
MSALLAHPDAVLNIVALVFVLSALFRAWMRRKRHDSKSDTISRRNAVVLPTALRATGALVLALALYRGTSLFLPGVSTLTAFTLAAALSLAVIVDTVSTCVWPAPDTVSRPSREIAPAVAVLAFGIGCITFVLYARSAPSNALHIQAPVRGKWAVASGGRLKLTNHHHNNPPSQNYAVDLISDAPGVPTEGQPVFTPIDGICLKASTDSSSAEGCHIVIRSAGNIDVMLAHLQEDSIMVKEGDRLTAGQKVGACGSTGSATQPHLHLHAEQNNRSIPLHFPRPPHFPVRGDRIAHP